jgi:hypothetical protein
MSNSETLDRCAGEYALSKSLDIRTCSCNLWVFTLWTVVKAEIREENVKLIIACFNRHTKGYHNWITVYIFSFRWTLISRVVNFVRQTKINVCFICILYVFIYFLINFMAKKYQSYLQCVFFSQDNDWTWISNKQINVITS